jgi:DNA-binding MarR family transcriptional regulator
MQMPGEPGASGIDGDAALRALDGLRRVLHLLRRSSHEAQRTVGLSGAQLFVLQQLGARPATSLKELSGRTLTHQSSVSVVVRRLEERGLVRRRRAAADGRRVELALTAKGRALLVRAPEPVQTRMVKALRSVPTSELRSAARTLERIAGAMGARSSEPSVMFFEEPEEMPGGVGRER